MSDSRDDVGAGKTDEPGPRDPRLIAAVEMIGRLGGSEFQLRFDDRDLDDGTPIVWSALARWGTVWQATGALSPWRAIFRLLEAAMDGGSCNHCGKPTVVDEHPADASIRITESALCWYRYDPERHTFRRSCEGVNP